MTTPSKFLNSQKKLIPPENILKKYVGTYAAADFPLELTFFIKNGYLFGQATGQQAIAFEASSNTVFTHTSASIHLEFKDEGKTLEFTQGKKFILTKK